MIRLLLVASLLTVVALTWSLATPAVAIPSSSSFLSASVAAPVQDDSPEALEGRVDRVFRKWNRADGPGCAVGVYRDGKLVFAKGYGMADLEHDVPIVPDTVFYIGSTSKQFVTACIVLLEEEGKLALDDDVRKFLPELPDYGTPITIRQLIHHTSGIRDYLELWSLAGRDYLDHIPEDAVLEMICAQKSLNFEPGEQHLYSNSCYFLLAVIVERATGKSLREYARAAVFGPLGMQKTHFHDDPGHIIKDRAFGYAPKEGGGFRSMMMRFALVGSGGLYTTVEDLLRWDRNFYDNKLGKGGPALLDTMHTKGRLRDGEEIAYAFALMHGEHKGLRTVHHGGALGGYRAQLLRFPEQRFSVAVLSNLAGFDCDTQAKRVADIYLADEIAEAGRATKGAAAAEAPASAEPEEVPIDAAVLRSYVGDYEVQPGFVIAVSMEGGRLFGKVPGQPRAPLLPSSRTDFFIPDDDGRVKFVLNAAGGIERMIVKAGGQTVSARRVVAEEAPGPTVTDFAGAYVCDELGVTYRVEQEGDEIKMRVGYGEPSTLTRVVPLVYQGGGLAVRFQATTEGDVTGFLLDTGRVKGLEFRRL